MEINRYALSARIDGESFTICDLCGEAHTSGSGIEMNYCFDYGYDEEKDIDNYEFSAFTKGFCPSCAKIIEPFVHDLKNKILNEYKIEREEKHPLHKKVEEFLQSEKELEISFEKRM